MKSLVSPSGEAPEIIWDLGRIGFAGREIVFIHSIILFNIISIISLMVAPYILGPNGIMIKVVSPHDDIGLCVLPCVGQRVPSSDQSQQWMLTMENVVDYFGYSKFFVIRYPTPFSPHFSSSGSWDIKAKSPGLPCCCTTLQFWPMRNSRQKLRCRRRGRCMAQPLWMSTSTYQSVWIQVLSLLLIPFLLMCILRGNRGDDSSGLGLLSMGKTQVGCLAPSPGCWGTCGMKWQVGAVCLYLSNK